MRIKELVGEHKSQIAPSLRHCLGTEDDPTDDSEEECQSHLECFFDVGQVTAIGDNMLILGVDAKDVIDGQQRGVEQAPADESPVGSMPQTADAPDDIYITDNLPLVTTAATQWEVDVVAEPCCQRDVPAAPELRDAAREVRIVEIAHQVEAKQTGTADGNV